MPATKVVMVRHGQTDYNVQARYQGQNDIMLNDTGLAQAEAMGRVLAARLSTPSKSVGVNQMAMNAGQVVIYSSPLIRAQQTARALAKALSGVGFSDEHPADDAIDVHVDPAFIERGYGVFEGHTKTECLEQWPDAFREMEQTGESPTAGVESARATGERVHEGLTRVVSMAPDGSTVIVVSHGTAINRGIIHMVGLDPLTFKGLRGMDNAHWAEITYEAGAESTEGDASRGIADGDVGGHWRIASYNLGADEGVVG